MIFQERKREINSYLFIIGRTSGQEEDIAGHVRLREGERQGHPQANERLGLRHVRLQIRRVPLKKCEHLIYTGNIWEGRDAPFYPLAFF